jgi:hypothetical protein
MPVRLLGEERRSVSRLEFYPLERPETLPEFEQEDETEVFLKEEVAALGGRLRSQAEQMSAEMELARSEERT